jgi:energy-converting hydrogenase A subunit M
MTNTEALWEEYMDAKAEYSMTLIAVTAKAQASCRPLHTKMEQARRAYMKARHKDVVKELADGEDRVADLIKRAESV